MNKSVGIVGVGTSIPEKIMTNVDFEKIIDTSDEWIRTRTGISERHIAEKNIGSSDLGAEAAKRALEDAGISAQDVDLIIVATATPDMYFPSTACIIQDKIGAKNAAAFDISAACTGFIYGLTVAKQFVETGFYKTILLIGAETFSKLLDWEDRNTCILFGDGAGAVVLKEVPDGYGILGTKIKSDGSSGHNLTAPALFANEDELAKRKPDKINTIYMNGSEVFKFAVKVMESSIREITEECNLSLEDINLIVPHQANIRIINSCAERLNVSSEKIFSNISKYGNISAASIPIALYESYKEGRIKNGDNVVLVGFGAGLTWGSSIIKWNK